ncbi:hypothetical protein ES703_56651 [subsurface metagenome]
MVGSFRRQFGAHTEPVRFLCIVNQDVGEDNFIGARQGIVNNGVVFWVDFANDAEDTLFNVHTVYSVVLFA